MQKIILTLICVLTFAAKAEVSNKVIAGAIANAVFLQGNIKETGRTFDLAIGGEGWIPLQKSHNQIVYSRYGELGMDRDGFLVHVPSGLPVVTASQNGDFAKISLAEVARRPHREHAKKQTNLVSMFFTEEGVLEGLYSDGTAGRLAKLNLAAFENQRHLKVLDAKAHLFEASSGVGEIAYGHAEHAPFGKVFARALEDEPAKR